MTANELERKVNTLREEFDRSFAEGGASERPEQFDFLRIRVAGDAYALRLSEIQNLHAGRKLVSAPSLVPGLLGMAGFRGLLTPVYDLSLLLGYGAQPATKWLVVARNASPVAFAFEVFEAHIRVDAARVSADDRGGSERTRGVVQVGTLALPLLHLPSLIAGIAARIKGFEPSQER